MKKNILILLFLMIMGNIFSQNEWFAYFKFGMSSYIKYSEMDNNPQKKGLYTPKGYFDLFSVNEVDVKTDESSLFPTSSTNFPVGFYVTAPFLITSGIEYQPVSIRNKYRTAILNDDGYYYYLNEMNTIHSISIPLFFDTRPFFSRIRFLKKISIYGGVRYHFNLQNSQYQKVSWEKEESKLRSSKLTDNEFVKSNISFAFGINITFINLELLYMPNPFLNTEFVDIYGNKPYENMQGGIINVSISITLGKLYHKN